MKRCGYAESIRGFRLILAFFREGCILEVVKKNYHIGFFKIFEQRKGVLL